MNDYINIVQNNSSKTKFYCNECDFSSTDKKTLKKHMDKYIHTNKYSDISVEEVKNHMENVMNARNVPNIDCDKCSKEEACEDCIEVQLDEWIAMGNG